VAKPALAAYMFDQVSQVAFATDAEIRAKSILEGKIFYTLGTPVPNGAIGCLLSQTEVESCQLPNYGNTCSEPKLHLHPDC
jgi:hypothetical protein